MDLQSDIYNYRANIENIFVPPHKSPNAPNHNHNCNQFAYDSDSIFIMTYQSLPKKNEFFASGGLVELTTHDVECVICKEPFDRSQDHAPVQIKKCGHVFGKSCLLTWWDLESSTHITTKNCCLCRCELFTARPSILIPTGTDDDLLLGLEGDDWDDWIDFRTGQVAPPGQAEAHRDRLWELFCDLPEREIVLELLALYDAVRFNDAGENRFPYHPFANQDQKRRFLEIFTLRRYISSMNANAGIWAAYHVHLSRASDPASDPGSYSDEICRPLFSLVRILEFLGMHHVRPAELPNEFFGRSLLAFVYHNDFKDIEWEIFEKAAKLENDKDWINLLFLSWFICLAIANGFYNPQKNHFEDFIESFASSWAGQLSPLFLHQMKIVTLKVLINPDSHDISIGRYYRLTVTEEEVKDVWGNAWRVANDPAATN